MTNWTGKFLFNTATHIYDFTKVITSQSFHSHPELLDQLLEQVDPKKNFDPTPIPRLIHPIMETDSKQQDEASRAARLQKERLFLTKIQSDRAYMKTLTQFAVSLSKNMKIDPDFGDEVCSLSSFG